MVFKKGNIPWNLDIPCPEDIKQKISDTLKNNISLERRKEMSEIEEGEKNHFYGKHHSKESKLKISEAKKGENHPNYGKHLTEETKIKIGKGNEGKQQTEEAKLKMSISHKGLPTWNKGKSQIATMRENNPNWKGGITYLTEQIRKCFKYRQWRSDIFYRDNYICLICGQKSGKLNAHHLISFNLILQEYEITTIEEALECEKLWSLNNGVTLCKECHRELHKSNKILKERKCKYYGMDTNCRLCL